LGIADGLSRVTVWGPAAIEPLLTTLTVPPDATVVLALKRTSSFMYLPALKTTPPVMRI
jgi:hypothetical protein